MIKNYYPRVKSVFGLCALALSISFLFSSKTVIAQPTITAVSSNAAIPGATITITGTGFNTTAASNTVYFGGVKTTPSVATGTTLTLTVPVGALNSAISVLNAGTYLTGTYKYPFVPEYMNTCFVPNTFNFKPKVDLTVPLEGTSNPYPYIATLGDLDNDGKLDLVVANHATTLNSDTMYVYRNTSSSGSLTTSSFAAPVKFQVAVGQSNIKIADLDGDGRLDVIVACNGGGGSIGVMRNISTGVGNINFIRRPIAPAGKVSEVAIADFDGDGKLDIAAIVMRVIATVGADSVKVYKNQIASPLAISANIPAAGLVLQQGFALLASSSPSSMSSGDFDGDGKQDLVVANQGPFNSVSVLRNSSVGTTINFDAHLELDLQSGFYAQQVLTGDLDADGKPDIIVTSFDYAGTGNVSIFRSQGTAGSLSVGSFATRNDIIPAGSYPTGIAVGDIDGDSKVDLLLSDAVGGTLTFYRNTSVAAGSITLSSALSFATGSSPIGITIGDLDGDTKPDVAVANSVSNSISIFRNYPLPITAPITGPATLCVPNVDTFKDAVAGGTWSVYDVTRATIDPVNGAVTPILAGVDTVYYRIICNNDTAIVKKSFTVGTFPTVQPITGGTGLTLCTGKTMTLSDATPSGVWSSSSTAATVLNGVVTGVSTGTATITYTVTNSCTSSFVTYGPIVINQSPANITNVVGNFSVCVGQNISLADATPGGVWASTTMPVATITATGVVHGVSAGTSVISYTLLPSGCFDTATVTVTAGPVVAAITGPFSVCQGSDITLLNSTPSGTWTSDTAAHATVAGGLVHGVAAGVAHISYTVTNGCGTSSVGHTVTVYPAPAAITGTLNVCPGSYTTLSNASAGGTWASSNMAAATVTTGGAVGGVAGGTTTISYTIGGGCYTTATVNVYNAPAAIGGATSVCQGSTVTLTDATTPGTWSQAGGFVSVNATSGAVTGVNAGTTAITYTATTTGCSITSPFTVNALPGAITGGPSVCIGTPTNLSSTTPGGVWTITPTTVANINSSTGAVTGVTTGSATVSYTDATTTCAVGTTVTVFPTPGNIVGSSTVCLGGFTSLTDPTPGGTWSSSNAVVAPVNAIGIVSGATLGTTTITYAITGSTCVATHNIQVTPPPAAIVGISTICPNVSIGLTDPTINGTWSSGNTAVAVINPTTGILTGVAGGTALITYTLSGTGCFVFSPISVNPGPTVSGPSIVCQGFTAGLLVDSTFGKWSSSDTANIKVDSVTGVVRGIATIPAVPHTALITFTTSAFGCADTMSVTSYPVIAPFVSITTGPSLTLTGVNDTVCQNTMVTYTANAINPGPAPTYQWKVNHINMGVGSSYSYTPSNRDTVEVILTSNATCVIPNKDTAFIAMGVITRRSPMLDLSTGIGDTTCLGNAVTLNPHIVNGGPNPTFNWHINGINVGPGSTFTYTPANNDFIQVKVTTSFVCPLDTFATDTLRLTVSPFLSPTITIVGADTSCEGYPTVYTAVATAAGTHPLYEWHVNGITVSTAPVLAYMGTTGDVVDVKLTSNFPCVTYSVITSAPRSVTVIPIDVPSVTISVTPGYILAPGMTATFHAAPVNPGGSPTYRWKKNGVLIPGASGLTYSTNVLGSGDSFTVILTNHDLCNGISAYASMEIAIGANVGIGQVNGSGSVINVMPNPTKGEFIIRGNIGITTNEEVKVEITNMLGQVVYSSAVNANNGGIEDKITLGSNLANGMYILNVHSEHLYKTVHFELAK